MSPASRRGSRLVSIAVGGTVVAVFAAGCGGSSSAAAKTSSGEGGAGAITQSFDSVSGKVIAASANSASVQQTSGPSTVDFSSQTRFTSTSTTTRSSLAKGDCVTVAGSAPTATSKSGSTGGATGLPTKVTARSVTVTSTSGCQEGNGSGRFGGPTRSFNGTPPPGGFGSGATPRPFPSGSAFPRRFGGGGPGTFRARFTGAFGQIASMTATSFTVTSTFGGSTRTTTVKTTSATTYDVMSSASASDVTRGSCVNAVGTTDVSGVLDARSVSISPPVNGACKATALVGGPGGFGGRGFGGPGGAAPTGPESGVGGV